MTEDLFDEPRAKIDRAKKHLAELAAAEAAFSDGEPVEVFVGTGSNGNPALLLRANAFPPLASSAIAGDILNNLRSALDLTVSAACRVNGKNNVSNTYFVIAKKGEDDWHELVKGKRKRMRAANPAIIKLTHSFKPWRDGNNLLCAISHLVGIDKHQALLGLSVHQGGIELNGLKAEHPTSNLVKVTGNAFAKLAPGKQTAEIMNFQEGASVSLEGPNRVHVRFAFEAVEVKPYIGAVTLLNDALREVTKIVEAFSEASRSGALR